MPEPSETYLTRSSCTNRYSINTTANHRSEDIINYGAFLRQDKQLRKANLHYIRYLPQFSDNIQLIQNACNCWVELSDFDRSRATLHDALEKERNDTRLLLTLGYTELSAGQAKTACQIFTRIVKIDVNYFDAWFNLAVAKAKSNELEEAFSCFRRAQQLKKQP